MIKLWRRLDKLVSQNFSSTRGKLEVTDDEELMRSLVQSGAKFNTRSLAICNDAISMWYRLERLIPHLGDLSMVESEIVQGDEKALRAHAKSLNKTRNELIEEARVLNVPYYGRLTKKELIKKIKYHQEHKICRQRYARQGKQAEPVQGDFQEPEGS